MQKKLHKLQKTRARSTRVRYNAIVQSRTQLENTMATQTEKQSSLTDDTRAVSFSHVERLYLQRAIDILVTQLNRSAAKETSPDVKVIRQNEVSLLQSCKNRLGA